MAETLRSLPTFASKIPQDDLHAALKVLEREHADYQAHKASWQVLIDAFEGTGGFLNGAYLFEYPREESTDFATRKLMARYHNYVESLVDLYTRYIWTQGVSRSSENEELAQFWQNADGKGGSIDDLLKQLASFGLVNGHAGVLVDKTADEPAGESKADERANVVASVFQALAVPDWRFDAEGLSAVKLLEAAPPVDIVTEEPSGDDATQYLLWDREGWARYDATGLLVGADVPNLGMVPFVVFRPKPSYLSLMLGRALCSNANVIKAIYNRASEEDEVIRAQAFSVLTVEVPQEGDVEQTKESLGTTIGAAKALVVKGAIKYETPDQNVPGAIRENIAYLVREVYRMAHVQYQQDGLQRQSGDSIRLQYTELNEMLQGFAKALTAAELSIARAFFAWQNPTPEAADAAYEAAKVTVTYPSEFFLDDLMTDLEAWSEAIRMDLGETANKTIKKRAVRRLLTDLTAKQLETIDGEIDALKDEPLPVPGALDMGDPEGQALKLAAPREREAVN